MAGILGARVASGLERPDRENDYQNERQPVPGDHILQVLVAQPYLELARLRKAARRHWRFLLDIEGSDVLKALGGRNGGRIAQEPEIMRRVVAGREP